MINVNRVVITVYDFVITAHSDNHHKELMEFNIKYKQYKYKC